MVIGGAIAALGAASAAAKSGVPHAVYTATNSPSGNAVVAFARKANGTLVQSQVIKTGGNGIASEPPFGFPIVDTQGSVNLSADGHWLFVVNAGSNTVTSFKVTASGLKRVSQVSSGGKLPVSLTSSGNLLYVLDELSGNIYGLRVSNTGKLTPVPKSKRSLSIAGPGGIAAGIGFAPGGHVLAVTMRDLPQHHGIINTFRIRADGSAGPAQAHTASTPTPFGFAFAGKHMIDSSAGYVATPSGTPPNVMDPLQFVGAVASYTVTSSGGLSPVNSALSGGRAACWVVVTNNNRYAFSTNTLSGSVALTGSGKGGVSRLSVASNGAVSLLGQVDTKPNAGGPAFPGEEALSNDSKYLYVLVPTIMGPNTSHIDVYRIGSGGSLTSIQSTPGTLASSISGLAGF